MTDMPQRVGRVADNPATDTKALRVALRQYEHGKATAAETRGFLEALGLVDYLVGARVDSNGARVALYAADQRAREETA